MFCDIKYQPIREGNMYVTVVWNNNLSTLLFAWTDIFLFFLSIVHFFDTWSSCFGTLCSEEKNISGSQLIAIHEIFVWYVVELEMMDLVEWTF